jgi:hypothetical protein
MCDDRMSKPNRRSSTVADLNDVRQKLGEEHGLAVVSTVQADGRVLSSVVNCGVIDHPATGEACLSFVSAGIASRLAHIRRGSEMTVTVRRGWNWVGVTGPAEIIGLDDERDGFSQADLPNLLQNIFRAAGGQHDDWAEFDRVMAAERRAAVFVSPARILGN